MNSPANNRDRDRISMMSKAERAWLAGLSIAALIVFYAARNLVLMDGEHYLDLALMWNAGDYWNAFDTLRSPGYPLEILLALKLFRPSERHYYFVIEALQFLNFGFALL